MTTDDGLVILAVDKDDKIEWDEKDYTHDLYGFKKEVQHEMVDAHIVMFIGNNFVRLLKEIY